MTYIDQLTGRPSYFVQQKIWLPSDDCVLLSFVGLFAAGIGIALSLHRRKFSWLSAAAFTLILLTMLVVVGCGMTMRVLP